MVMTDRDARDRLEHGEYMISQERPHWDRRQNYLDGIQDLPYAPQGVNEEYMELREQAIANWLDIAMGAPLQRLRCEGIRNGRGEVDQDAWTNLWQPNNLDSRQRTVYSDMLVHKRGLMSVWPNADDKSKPIIRPESGRQVYLNNDVDDPWTQDWGVKRVDRDFPHRRTSSLWIPENTRDPDAVEIGWVYDHDSWFRYERTVTAGGTTMKRAAWEQKAEGRHTLGGVPFIPFDNRPTSGGVARSDIEQLMPAQDALNTIRFQTLLALQFSAYRQRIVSGFDPVARDADGKPIYQKDAEGNVIVDPVTGMPIPIVISPGRPGVDRLLVFPGDATKIFDLPESNLDNYVTVLGEFLVQLFAVGQVPPQYLLTRMANLSGDALTAAESTLTSKVKGLQTVVGESLELVMRMANRAAGNTGDDDFASEIVWAEAEVRTFAQVVDAIVKLISSGMAVQDAWAFLPDATPPRLDQWKKNAEVRAREAIAMTAGAKGAMPLPGGAQPGIGDVAMAGGNPRAIAGRTVTGSEDLG